jgi:F-type H+-transporting ATPase subunit gamma
MPSTKEIRSRIKSIKNTEKITRAMELISTIKMKKSQGSVRMSRPFAKAVSEVL